MDDLTVTTTSGPVRGTDDGGVVRFLGVPYGAPPVGARRFRPATPPAPWSDVFVADRIGPRAPQLPSPMEVAVNGGDPPPWDEAGCLTLNVWTPGLDGARRPVMVWVHGGAFLYGAGSSPWYDGRGFAADQDVVLVSFNYRLGVLGFTYLGHLDPTLSTSGSIGVHDAVTVLRWVRDNIAAFGGDPDNVTIFGESAGAMSVGTLLGVPAAAPLFHRAILQSGSATSVVDADTAAARTDELLRELGVEGDPVAALCEMPVEALLKGHGAWLAARVDEGLASVPTVDGEFLPRAPLDAVRAGDVAAKPLLIGTNRDEWRLFAISNRKFMATSEEDLPAKVARWLPDDPHGAIKQYRQRLTDDPPSVVLAAVTGDATFRIPAIRLADAQAHAGGASYVYLFTFASSRAGGLLGSCHALELPFVFNTLDKPGVVELTGDAPPQSLATAIHATWAAYARTGDPGAGPLGPWTRYDEVRRPTMVLDVTPALEDDPLADERRVWMDR